MMKNNLVCSAHDLLKEDLRHADLLIHLERKSSSKVSVTACMLTRVHALLMLTTHMYT